MNLKCPHCGNEEQNLIMGHEVPFVYDGVLYWSCMKCDRAWSRHFEGMPLRQATSERYVKWVNEAHHA